MLYAKGLCISDGVFPAAQRLIGAAANQQQQIVVGAGPAQRAVRKQTSGRNSVAGKQQIRGSSDRLTNVGLVEQHMEQIMTVQDQEQHNLLEPEVQVDEIAKDDEIM